jgi:hypothetical protein
VGQAIEAHASSIIAADSRDTGFGQISRIIVCCLSPADRPGRSHARTLGFVPQPDTVDQWVNEWRIPNRIIVFDFAEYYVGILFRLHEI